jgi:hypothetical protein
MEIETNYTNMLTEVSKTNKTSSYEEEIKVSYDDYSIEDLRDIPYAEAKENLEEIRDRLNTLDENDKNLDRDEYVAVLSQLNAIDYSNNDSTNQALYKLKQDMTNSLDTISFDLNLQINMQDYYYGKEMNASFVKGNGSNELHSNQPLNKAQISNIDFNDFISKIIKTFTEDMDGAPQSVKEQYRELINTYGDLQINYEKSLSEPYYA